jgi:hypothetical protein
MDSNLKFVNNSIDSEDNPFVIKSSEQDKIDESGEIHMNIENKKRRHKKAVVAPNFILKEGEVAEPDQISLQ